MQSVFANMQDRLKFETDRLHFRRHIAGMVLLSHLTNFSKFQVMDKHVAFLRNLCRLCGNSVKNEADVAKKTAFKRELLEKFSINIDEDSSEIHPGKVCPPCKRFLYRVRESGNVDVTSWNYLMALHVFRMGVRRNNTSYVKAGQKVFAPLFHRNIASKYALINLHDR